LDEVTGYHENRNGALKAAGIEYMFFGYMHLKC
jgi:hypothetical protein